MKINSVQLGEVLMDLTLGQFQNVPAEGEIDHTFSQSFQEKIQGMSKKSESVTWRVWQAPVKRAVLIAILIMIMLVTVACATPVIRNAIIDFFFVEDKIAYGMTFAPYTSTSVPQVLESVCVPALDQKGYILAHTERTQFGLEYLWENEHDEYIYYSQSIMQQGTPDRTWVGIDAEETKRTTQTICGHWVEIISNEAEQQYVAVWTDNRYIYTVDISVMGSNQETILEAMMDGLVEVETIS